MDYKKLFKDKSEGKISDDMAIVIDNDSGYWACEADVSEDVREKREAEYNERYGCPDGYGDIVVILEAAGFNAEWC